jgi:hypothetical protein
MKALRWFLIVIGTIGTLGALAAFGLGFFVEDEGLSVGQWVGTTTGLAISCLNLFYIWNSYPTFIGFQFDSRTLLTKLLLWSGVVLEVLGIVILLASTYLVIQKDGLSTFLSMFFFDRTISFVFFFLLCTTPGGALIAWAEARK